MKLSKRAMKENAIQTFTFDKKLENLNPKPYEGNMVIPCVTIKNRLLVAIQSKPVIKLVEGDIIPGPDGGVLEVIYTRPYFPNGEFSKIEVGVPTVRQK